MPFTPRGPVVNLEHGYPSHWTGPFTPVAMPITPSWKPMVAKAKAKAMSQSNEKDTFPFGWISAGNLWARQMKAEDVAVKTILTIIEIAFRAAGGQATKFSSKVDGADYYKADLT